MPRPSLSRTHETIVMTIRVPADTYDRLITQAERRGWTWGGGPAQARAVVAAIDLGLPLLEKQRVRKN